MKAQCPLGERDVASLHHGPDRDGKLFVAFIALIDTGAVRLAFQLRNLFGINVSAMRTPRAMRPTPAFEILAGLVLVAEDGISEICHWLILNDITLLPSFPLSSA